LTAKSFLAQKKEEVWKYFFVLNNHIMKKTEPVVE